jgi:uncharacterized protein
MLINIRDVFEGAIKKLSIAEHIPSEDLWQTGSAHTDGCMVNGLIENRSGIVRLSLECKTTVNEQCDRCLEPLKAVYTFPVENILVTDENADSDEYLIVDGIHLNLTEVAVDNFLINHPSKILCKDDCLGLDPETGVNLNARVQTD